MLLLALFLDHSLDSSFDNVEACYQVDLQPQTAAAAAANL
jgi:hypothetical protein